MKEAYNPTKDPHLATWRERSQMGIRKMRCPECRRVGYKPYIHPDGQMVAEECGRCDHESSCGYHMTPREWFRTHPSGSEHWNPSYVPPPPPPAIEIPARCMYSLYCLRRNAPRNPLLRYWTTTFRKVEEQYCQLAEEYVSLMLDVLRRFCVGTMEGGYTVWWIVDETGKIRSGKAMRYKDDGHRDKSCATPFVWMHRLPELACHQPADAEYLGCLFGLHQLKAGTKEVHIVESEKTAVLMSVFKPAMTWMATMGLGNLNKYKLAPLIERGVRIVCHPDYDGSAKWADKVQAIRADCPEAKVEIDDYVSRAWMPGDSSTADLLDIMERDYKILYSV